MNILYFGCWNSSGHYLYVPGGQSARDDGPSRYGDRVHIDGSLAPRRVNKRWLPNYGQMCWVGQAGPAKAVAG